MGCAIKQGMKNKSFKGSQYEKLASGTMNVVKDAKTYFAKKKGYVLKK